MASMLVLMICLVFGAPSEQPAKIATRPATTTRPASRPAGEWDWPLTDAQKSAMNKDLGDAQKEANAAHAKDVSAARQRTGREKVGLSKTKARDDAERERERKERDRSRERGGNELRKVESLRQQAICEAKIVVHLDYLQLSRAEFLLKQLDKLDADSAAEMRDRVAAAKSAWTLLELVKDLISQADWNRAGGSLTDAEYQAYLADSVMIDSWIEPLARSVDVHFQIAVACKKCKTTYRSDSKSVPYKCPKCKSIMGT